MSIRQMWAVTGVNTTTGAREPRLLVAAHRSLFVSDPDDLTTVTQVGSSNILHATNIPQGAQIGNKVYIVDGSTNIFVVNLGTSPVSVSTMGGTHPEGATIACAYRERLVVAGFPSEPQNYQASKLGDPTNWDEAEVGPDGAFSGNNRDDGKVGDRIVALIPFVNDFLIFGGDSTIFRMTGDIRDGGRIDKITDQVGVLGPNAWTTDPAGTIYFVGTPGLFKLSPGSAPVNLTANRMDSFFRAISREDYYLNVDWDRDRHGAFFHLTPKTEQASVHLFYDARLDAWYGVQYPNWYGPVSTAVFDGGDSNDRVLCLGARSSFVLRWTDSAKTDDGVPIESYVMLGPISAPEGEEMMLTQLDLTMGETPAGFVASDHNCRVRIYAGDTPWHAMVTPTTVLEQTITTAGRQSPVGFRLTANTFWMELYNATAGKLWIFERAAARFRRAGRRR